MPKNCRPLPSRAAAKPAPLSRSLPCAAAAPTRPPPLSQSCKSWPPPPINFRLRLNTASPSWPAADDWRPQSATLAQAVLDPLEGQRFQMAARLAEADPSQHYFADFEFLPDQMIQRHTAGDQVPPCLTGLEGQLRLALERFDG